MASIPLSLLIGAGEDVQSENVIAIFSSRVTGSTIVIDNGVSSIKIESTQTPAALAALAGNLFAVTSDANTIYFNPQYILSVEDVIVSPNNSLVTVNELTSTQQYKCVETRAAIRALINAASPPIGTEITGTLTAGKIPVASGAHSLIDSLLTQAGANISMGGVGKLVVPNLQITTGAGAGLVWTSDASGNGSWQVNGTGTVTQVSVVSANGFAGSVATDTTTPAITISTTITGILKGNGTAISAATDADITGKVLTGYVSGAGVVAATDSILQAIQKLNGNAASFITSVTGTANRITSTGGTTPVIDISAAYVGQTSITTFGTITTGTLGSGAIISGVTMTLGSDATGDVYYRNAGGILTRLAIGANGTVMTSNGTIPTWAAAGGANWMLDGNTVGSEKWLGTIDNFALPFRTNNTEWMRLNATGELGIGVTASANTRLSVKGFGTTSATIGLEINDSANTLGSKWQWKDDGIMYLNGKPSMHDLANTYLNIGSDANNPGTAWSYVRMTDSLAVLTIETRATRIASVFGPSSNYMDCNTFFSFVSKAESGVSIKDGYVFDTEAAYVNAGSNLAVIKNGGTAKITIDINGRVGLGVAAPASQLHFAAGTATAGTSPIQFTQAGSALLGTPVVGVLEFVDDGTTGHLYITRNVATITTRTLIV